jgi:cyclophilin family peptidyl-prolyl cis-trans isomerase
MNAARIRALLASLALLLSSALFAQDAPAEPTPPPATPEPAAEPAPEPDLEPGIYADIDSSEGKMLLRLHYEKVPMTVINFISLAEGTGLSATRDGRFYDGLSFHRCIPDFMIQGGCPQGNGTGGPGYKFADEFHPHLKHDGAGVLSMANSGPATNGSQFYITHKATPWLDNKHSVFGHIVSGQDVVNKIQKGATINKLNILRVGDAAKAFKADGDAFTAAKAAHALRTKDAPSAAEVKQIIDALYSGGTSTPSGLYQIIRKPGTGEPPAKGAQVSAHYTGSLISGNVFDSSTGMLPYQFNVGTGSVIKGWDEAFSSMRKGEQRTIIIPPNLAYGAAGAGGIIPPDATLIFDVELVDIK